MTDSVHRKGVSHRLELELCAWLFRMVVHPMVPHGPGALGRAHLQACGDPLEGQGRLRSEACRHGQFARVALQPTGQVLLLPTQARQLLRNS